ncbi:MAG: hypothetical protein JNM69_07580, partial [Archangium sp.]|nr:hypothetical protein [Archangium sp.]
MKDIRTPIRRRRRARRAVRAETRAPKGLADAGLPLDTAEPRRANRKKPVAQTPAAAFEPLPSAQPSEPELPWRHIVNSGTLAKFFVGVDGLVRFANSAAIAFVNASGYSGQVVGARFDALASGLAPADAALKNPPQSPFEFELALGGRSYAVAINGVFDEQHAPLGCRADVRDVTDTQKLHQAFETMASVEGSARRIGEAASNLSHIANQLAAGATETSAQSMMVNSAAEEIKGSVASVASAAEEMSATVKEIASNATESAKTARSARETAESASAMVQGLSSASANIGKITKVISTIAQQTNLLAL